MSKERNHGLIKRIAIDVAGFSMIIAAPFLGWLPGPGGIPLFLAGLGVLSLNYEWPERILKDFDRQRRELTEQYLVNNRQVSLAIDITAVALIAAGVYLLLTSTTLIPRGIGIGLTTGSLIMLLSNQNRVDRLINKRKSNKK